MSVNSNDPRRDAHKDREDYIKSQAYEAGRQAIINNPYAWHADGRKGLAVFDGIDTNDGNATTQGAGTATTQTTPLTTPTASNTNPDIVAKIDPAIVKETPKEVVKDAKDADEWSRYIDSLYSESDREADEKKKKAAKWILAAQMMGDTFSALANSYFTAKGANAMTAPSGTQKAAEAAGKLEMDIRAARKAADKERMDAMQKKFAMDMQREAHDLNKTKLLNDVDYQRKMLDLNMQKFIREGVQADRAYELSLKQLGLDERRLLLSEQELKARKNGSYYAGNGGGGGSSKGQDFTLPDGTITIKDFNFDKLMQIYNSVPADKRKDIEERPVRDKYGEDTGETENVDPSQEAMLRLIYNNLDDPNVRNAIKRLGGVTSNSAGSSSGNGGGIVIKGF